MKRSEAVQLILDTYHKGMSVKEKMMSGMESDQADKILTALEEAGMVPPIIKSKSFILFPNGEMTYAVHEWVNENET